MARGLTTAGWEEIALTERTVGGRTVKVPEEAFLDRDFRPYVWNNVWGLGAEDVAYKLANAGYKVVLSGASSLYFDHAYDKDPDEPGFYWAGFADTRTPYELVPFDLFKTALTDLMGNALRPVCIRRPCAPDRHRTGEHLGTSGTAVGRDAQHPRTNGLHGLPPTD